MIMKTFLVAVDFSDAANLVVEKAGGLAQQLSARIVLLHVFEPKPAYVPMGQHLKDLPTMRRAWILSQIS